MLVERREFDYIVVGSGAGGGPLAANLAEAGHDVLLLEAGGEEEPLNYQVPAWHANATEDPELRWDYFCRHYSHNPERDPKHKGGRLGMDNYDAPDLGGIYYPRAGTLGGCTAHHALITVYPHRADWDHIAQVTGDDSWRAANMRRYFDRTVYSQVNNITDLLVGLDPRGKLERMWDWFRDLFEGKPGDDGWLPVNQADVKLAAGDKQLARLIVSVIARAKKEKLRPMPRLDPNSRSVERKNGEGINLLPISTNDSRRVGSRERIKAVRDAEGSTLTVQTHTLVTRVLFDDGEPPRALGVDCRHGEHLYEADPRYREPGFEPRYEEVSFRARKEVILAGGAFNTPQLLMLSGVGDPRKLAAHGIEVKVPLPGVGKNLQDRYEVGVVYELAEDHALIQGAEFGRQENGQVVEDLQLGEWRQGGGIYTTNGALIGIIKRSNPRKAEPDLYIFGVPGYFEGYYAGYSKRGVEKKNLFTWAVLKGHTENRGGEVNLRSADPSAMPDIHFRYFDEGSGNWQDDADSVVAGMEFVERIMQSGAVKRRLIPGDEYAGNLRGYVTDNAWGHHASCSCKMGKDPDGEEEAVVDSRFRVHKTRGLRVVDASIFPRIPGLFILASVYIVSEKASDAILEDA